MIVNTNAVTPAEAIDVIVELWNYGHSRSRSCSGESRRRQKRTRMQAATDLVNAIVDVNGTMADTQALFRIRTTLDEVYAETSRYHRTETTAAAVR